nr:DUF6538 domain-containing protein [Methylobacterium indicum]
MPDTLRPRLRLTELVRSLATSDLRAAKARACRVYLASESLFTALCATPMLTEDQLARLVQDFSGTILDGDGQGRLPHAAITADMRERRVAQYETMAAQTRDALACNRLEEVGWACPGSMVLAQFAWIRRQEPCGASGDRGLPVRSTGA